LTVAASLMVGSFIAKPFVLRLAPETFRKRCFDPAFLFWV
jgi:hypothetical protein